MLHFEAKISENANMTMPAARRVYPQRAAESA
jgi:hypothetical protein